MTKVSITSKNPFVNNLGHFGQQLLVNTTTACRILGGVNPRTLRKWGSDFGVTQLRRGYYLTSDIHKLVSMMQKRVEQDVYFSLKKIGL